jgi:NAD(P)-dependent dehydrogenase (short-subunit alcohol dehydrogenase family)
MKHFRDKVAVITGGASGIGLAIARALIKRGSKVIIADINTEDLDSAALELGSNATVFTCNVADLSSVKTLAENCWIVHGHVDLVFNNAGVISKSAAVVDTDFNDFKWVMDVNVGGVWNGCHVFGKRLIEQGSIAHIINTGSENSIGIPNPNIAPYTASKHAVLAISDVLREELPDFIGVSIICPGVANTGIGTAINRRPEEYGGVEDIYQGGDLSSGINPEEIAEHTLDAILRGDFYIVTHPHVREFADVRHQEITVAFDEQAPYYQGSEQYNPREIMKKKGLL